MFTSSDRESLACLVVTCVVCCGPCVVCAQGVQKHPKVSTAIAITAVAIAVIGGTIGILAATGQLGSVVQFASNAWDITAVKIGLIAGGATLLLGGIVAVGCCCAKNRHMEEELASAPMSHYVPTVYTPPVYTHPVQMDEPVGHGAPMRINRISEEEILDRFYNQLPLAAVLAHQKGLLSKDDLETAEPFTFIGISALASFQVIEESRKAGKPHGIVMSTGPCVTVENSPNEFKGFFRGLEQMREKLKPYWGNETAINLLISMLVNNPETEETQTELRNQLDDATSTEVSSIVAIATNMAIQISQKPRFQGDRGQEALQACAEYISSVS